MKKIIFCDNSLRELVNFREDVYRSYAEKGYCVYLVAPPNREYRSDDENIIFVPIELQKGGMNPIQDIRYFLTLYKLYRKIRPVFIFHYTVKPNIYGSLSAWLNRIPCASMIAGLGYLFSNKSFKAKIGRLMYRLALRIPKKIMVLNRMNVDVILEKGFAKESQIVFLEGGEGINLTKFR